MKAFLSQSGVHCVDKSGVLAKIDKIISEGPDRFQLITDFDRTLTKYRTVIPASGKVKLGVSSFEVLHDSDVLPQTYREETEKLREKYYPMETDHTMSLEEKLPHMLIWWNRAFELMTIHKIQHQNLVDAVSKSVVSLRGKSSELFQLLRERSIPVIVLSAGVGDTVKEILRQKLGTTDGMTIISNFLKFSDDGFCLGLTGELTHVFNKGEHASTVAEHLGRPNAIVMGDMLSDLDVVKGHEVHYNNLLKIGFLNVRVEEQLEMYMEDYDVVLTDDQDLDFLLDIIKAF